MTNSCSGTVRNCHLNEVSRFWKPLTPGPPGGCRCVHVLPIETPNVSVIFFDHSAEISVWRAEGSSPFLNSESVGSESSSATQGRSTLRVAGRKRAPRDH